MTGKIVFHKSKILWEVDTDSLSGKKNGEFIKSPTFSISNSQFIEYEWRLDLYPKGVRKDIKNHISIYLTLLNNDFVSIDYSISILNQDNEIYECKDANTLFKNRLESWGWQQCIEQSSVNDPNNKILRNNKLCILCGIIINTNLNNNAVENHCIKSNANRLNHFDKYEELLKSKACSDVVVVSGEKKFHLHKCILITHSDVFKAMFSRVTKNKNQNRVEIKDTTCEVLEELFRFIYTGKVGDIEKIACELFTAAEKYNVKDLKILCEEAMCANLELDNSVDYFNFADSNNAEKLKAASIEYMSEHLEPLSKKQKYNEIADSKLLKDLTKKYFNP